MRLCCPAGTCPGPTIAAPALVFAPDALYEYARRRGPSPGAFA